MPTHKLILIALLFAILQQTESASLHADKELCKLKEPDADQTLTQALTTTPIYVSQDTCVQRFTLDLNDPMWKSQFHIYIEVQFDPFPDPSPEFSMLLLEGDDEEPIIYYSASNKSLHEDAATGDYDAYRNRKTFHRINLNTRSIKRGDTRMRYFAVYKLFEDLRLYADNSHVVSYTIRARTSQKFECINDCNGQGECDSSLQQCVCHAGFFDSDCSVKALRLNSGISQSQKVPPQKSAYYYTPYQSEDDIFKFSFSVNKPEWNMAVQFNYPKDFLINSRHAFQFTNRYPLSVLQASKEYSSTATPALEAYLGGEILVFVSNPTDKPMYATVQVDISGKEKKNFVLIIAIVAGITLFFVVLGAFVTAKCRAKARTARSLVLEEAQRATRQRASVQGQQQSVFLTKEEIEKYFPLKQFSELKTSFSQSACSICLDDFTADSKCHQLYCEHIFHDNCIEAWLAKQSNCPNCKSEMNKESIEEFLKEEKPQKSKPKSLQIELKINSENHENEADRGKKKNSVYEDSEANPIELQSPIGSPLASPHSSRMLMGDRNLSELQSQIASPLASPRSSRMPVGDRDQYVPNFENGI